LKKRWRTERPPAKPDRGQAKPDRGQAKPDRGQVKPGKGQTKPGSGTKPGIAQSGQAKPRGAGRIPERGAAAKHAPPPKQERRLKTLDRVLSKLGVCSRTESREWIEQGRLQVNGQTIRDPEQWVDLDRDRIALDGKPVRAEQKTYLALNKPKGYITSYTDPDGRKTIYDLLKTLDQWVFPVGRLDLDTSGLLLLTNDSEFAEHITSPEHHVAKTYLVKSSLLLTDEQLRQLRDGVELNDGPTRPAQVRRVRDSEKYTFLEITITEGRNRQVRRMVEALGATVLKLVRVSIGTLRIGTLQIGQWRALTPDEVRVLRHAGGNH
jgi:pseudouridine synthase